MEIPELNPPNPHSVFETFGAAALEIDQDLRRSACRLLRRLELHHAHSYAHSVRVARLTMAMQRAAPGWLGSAGSAFLASVLHDVGKLDVPATYLASDRALSAEERQSVMTHSAAGASLLAALGFPAEVVEVAAHHHERWSAGGYPTGRAAKEFSRLTRAVAMADAFTAMTEPGRPYRIPLTPEAARREVEDCQGKHFDPEAVAILMRCIPHESDDRHAPSFARHPSEDNGGLAQVLEQFRRLPKARQVTEAAF